MNENLRQMMALDMNIMPFENETEESFNQRLIYSAGAEWVKTLVYGHSYADIVNLDKTENEFTNVDIMYIKEHLTNVMEAYLQVFPISRNWFNEKDLTLSQKANKWAGRIIRDTISTYNIAEVKCRRITPVLQMLYKYGSVQYLLQGDSKTDYDICNVGVARWIILSDSPSEYDIDTRVVAVKLSDYYEVLNKQANWKNINLTSKCLRFKLGRTSGYSKCWGEYKLNDIKESDEISVLKIDDKYNGGYFMVKRENGELLIADLDPWYTSSRELYRILYALNFHNGTPAEVRVKQENDHYILFLGSALPEYENRIIMNCSWPATSYHSAYQRIIPNMLWEIAKQALEYLDIRFIYL